VLIFAFSLAKAARGGAVFRFLGVMPSISDGGKPLTPIDRNTPVGNAEHRHTASPYGMASGTLPSP